MKHRAVLKPILVAALAVFLSSCLSTDVSIDFRDDGEIGLHTVYTMPKAVWELGVFDSTSPERAIPISARDARETANLYADVTLVDHTVREAGDQVTVEIMYSIGSAESLADLWGWAGEHRLEFEPETGFLRIPVNGERVPVDEDQRELIREVFRNQQFTLTLSAPGELNTTGPELPDASLTEESDTNTATWSAPLGSLLLHEDSAFIEARWELPQ
ncbi:MAG TPA: hypothetical protein VJ932_06590 [Alkalispirochaeta sp.]|nr:hypothetical protein [Alkalispirochaeta sp.]